MTETEKLKQLSQELNFRMIQTKIIMENLSVFSNSFEGYSHQYCVFMLQKDRIDKQVLEIETKEQI